MTDIYVAWNEERLKVNMAVLIKINGDARLALFFSFQTLIDGTHMDSERSQKTLSVHWRLESSLTKLLQRALVWMLDKWMREKQYSGFCYHHNLAEDPIWDGRLEIWRARMSHKPKARASPWEFHQMWVWDELCKGMQRSLIQMGDRGMGCLWTSADGCIWVDVAFYVFWSCLWQILANPLGESSSSVLCRSQPYWPSQNSHYWTDYVAHYFSSQGPFPCQSADSCGRWSCRWNLTSFVWLARWE